MEILDALEQKVAGLLEEVKGLRARNAELEKKLAGGLNAGPGGEQAAQHIAELKQALEDEKNLKEAVLKRINTLVQHLEDNIKD